MGENNFEEYEPIISDGNLDFYNKEPQDYKSIVLKCIQEILKINTTLLSSTGKIYLKIQGQIIQKEENTLKIFYQLVNTLEDLLLFWFDEKIEEEIKEQDNKLKNIYLKYLKILIERQPNETQKYKIQREGVITNESPLGKYCLEKIEEETKQCYRKKFRSLLLLYKRKNELSNTRTAKMGVGSYGD